MDLIHRPYFYAIRPIGMKDRSLIDEINLTFIALTTTAIHHCLLAWNLGQFRVPLEFGSGSAAQHKCDTRNIHQAVDNARTDVFRRHNGDRRCSSPEVQAKMIVNIHRLVRQSIQSTVMDPAIAQPHNNRCCIDEDFLDQVTEELIEQFDNSSNCLSILVAATDATMRASAVLPMGGSAIASSSQPVPWSNSNSNNNDITSITNMTSIDNMGLVNGSTIVEGAMLLGG